MHVFAGGALPGGHLGCGEGEGGNAKGEEEAVWWWEKREAKKKSVCEKKSNDEKRERERKKTLNLCLFLLFHFSRSLSFTTRRRCLRFPPASALKLIFKKSALVSNAFVLQSLTKRRIIRDFFLSLSVSLTLTRSLDENFCFENRFLLLFLLFRALVSAPFFQSNE